jgi:hypothetical protein
MRIKIRMVQYQIVKLQLSNIKDGDISFDSIQNIFFSRDI